MQHLVFNHNVYETRRRQALKAAYSLKDALKRPTLPRLSLCEYRCWIALDHTINPFYRIDYIYKLSIASYTFEITCDSSFRRRSLAPYAPNSEAH
jgi:hypothetical protein